MEDSKGIDLEHMTPKKREAYQRYLEHKAKEKWHTCSDPKEIKVILEGALNTTVRITQGTCGTRFGLVGILLVCPKSMPSSLSKYSPEWGVKNSPEAKIVFHTDSVSYTSTYWVSKEDQILNIGLHEGYCGVCKLCKEKNKLNSEYSI